MVKCQYQYVATSIIYAMLESCDLQIGQLTKEPEVPISMWVMDAVIGSIEVWYWVS